MNQLAKLNFDTNGLISQAETHEAFKNKVSETIKTLSERLPTDFSKLPVTDGDNAEKQVQTVINKIKDTANEYQKNRMEYTRKFDEIKKHFTSSEKEIKEDLQKLEDFVTGWNAEKLKRQRAEEEKIRKEQEEKQKAIELRHEIKVYFMTLLIKYYNEQLEALENAYYGMKPEELELWGSKFKDFDTSVLRKKWLSVFGKNGFFDSPSESEEKLEKEIFEAEILKCVDERIGWIDDKIKELIIFIPSRLEQLKTQDEKAKAEEAKRLAEKRAKELADEKAKAEAEAEAEAQSKLIEEKTAAVVESIDAEPATELTKGASVKYKYYPKDKGELLKIINWYLQNEYVSEDFEKLNSRLSFMRTVADRALNQDGEIISGVMYKEEISKRRTK